MQLISVLEGMHFFTFNKVFHISLKTTFFFTGELRRDSKCCSVQRFSYEDVKCSDCRKCQGYHLELSYGDAGDLPYSINKGFSQDSSEAYSD